jgi:hypothetical protein
MHSLKISPFVRSTTVCRGTSASAPELPPLPPASLGVNLRLISADLSGLRALKKFR